MTAIPVHETAIFWAETPWDAQTGVPVLALLQLLPLLAAHGRLDLARRLAAGPLRHPGGRPGTVAGHLALPALRPRQRPHAVRRAPAPDRPLDLSRRGGWRQRAVHPAQRPAQPARRYLWTGTRIEAHRTLVHGRVRGGGGPDVPVRQPQPALVHAGLGGSGRPDRLSAVALVYLPGKGPRTCAFLPVHGHRSGTAAGRHADAGVAARGRHRRPLVFRPVRSGGQSDRGAVPDGDLLPAVLRPGGAHPAVSPARLAAHHGGARQYRRGSHPVAGAQGRYLRPVAFRVSGAAGSRCVLEPVRRGLRRGGHFLCRPAGHDAGQHAPPAGLRRGLAHRHRGDRPVQPEPYGLPGLRSCCR